MTEEKMQKLATKIVDEFMIPEVQAMVEDARKAGSAEANEQIRLALFNLDEDDPVRANIARAREILLGVIKAQGYGPKACDTNIRECAEAGERWRKKQEALFRHGEPAFQPSTLRAAILSVEPEPCRGNECESFDCEVCDSSKKPAREEADVTVTFDDKYGDELHGPAQDDGKPEVEDGALKLEPCPHCGSHISVALVSSKDEGYDEDDDPAEHGASYHVVCNFNAGGCGAGGGYSRSIDDAIALWNRRPSSEASRG